MLSTVLKNLSFFFEKNPKRKQVLCKKSAQSGPAAGSCCDFDIECNTFVKPKTICMWRYKLDLDNPTCPD